MGGGLPGPGGALVLVGEAGQELRGSGSGLGPVVVQKNVFLTILCESDRKRCFQGW